MMRSENGISSRATADNSTEKPFFSTRRPTASRRSDRRGRGRRRDKVADVDAVRDEDGPHAALAQARRHVGVAGDDDRCAATPPCELRRLDFAGVARVRGEAVRHAELAGGARRNFRRRVREVAVHTGDVRSRAGARPRSRLVRSRSLTEASRRGLRAARRPGAARRRHRAWSRKSRPAPRRHRAQRARSTRTFPIAAEIRSRSSQCAVRVGVDRPAHW